MCLSINIGTTYIYCTCVHFYENISYVEISRECKRQLGVRFGFCLWKRIIIFIHCICWRFFIPIYSLSRSGSRQWLVGNVLWNVKQELTCTECNFCLNITDIIDSYQSISQKDIKLYNFYEQNEKNTRNDRRSLLITIECNTYFYKHIKT